MKMVCKIEKKYNTSITRVLIYYTIIVKLSITRDMTLNSAPGSYGTSVRLP